jgi:hypothetical protein
VTHGINHEPTAFRAQSCRESSDAHSPAKGCTSTHSALRTPHSAFRIPHSTFRIPHSALRIQHYGFSAASSEPT